MNVEPVFRQVGESRYQLEIGETGIVLDIDRLRRDRHELVGELAVICPIAGAHTVDGGLIHLADFNLSSAQARTTRAKLLRDRSEADLDWATYLERLCLLTLRAERAGTPARALHEFDRRTESPTWTIHGWQLPKHHPAILFGDGGVFKSYLALLVLGTLAKWGIPTLYCDWELDGEDHGERLYGLFGIDVPTTIHYLRCERPLVDEADRIRREVGRLGIEYAVFDSVGFATPGPPEAAEMATGYFRAVRQIGCGGSLHLAHTTKAVDDEPKRFKGLKPFGSTFWHNSARSTWFIRRADDDIGDGPAVVGLYHQKTNTGPLLRPVGLSVAFTGATTTITKADLADSADLARGLSLRQRLATALKAGPKTIVALAAETGAKKDSIEKTLKRNPGTFTNLVQTPDGVHQWALVHRDKGGVH
jgi:hypothetical protein